MASQSAFSDPSRRKSYLQQAKQADRQMWQSWNNLKPTEQRILVTTYVAPLVESVNSPALLKSPPRILLQTWTQRFATPRSPQGDQSKWEQAFQPDKKTVSLFTKLADRFSELGMTAERRKTLKLLKRLKPSTWKDDSKAKKIWAEQLTVLAEELRKSNDYLEAGRLYALSAKESGQWERRAEALYKGGLLLYRAGRRQEAIDAFRRASEDGENLFYASLAQERLDQLDK